MRQAVATGAKWAGNSKFDGWLNEALNVADTTLRAGLLDVAASRGLAAPRLLECLRSPDAAVVEAASRAARFAGLSRHVPLLQRLLDHDLPAVRDAALVACLAWDPR